MTGSPVIKKKSAVVITKSESKVKGILVNRNNYPQPVAYDGDTIMLSPNSRQENVDKDCLPVTLPNGLEFHQY